MAQKVGGINDGPRMTVDLLVGNPLFLQRKILDMSKNGFISPALLRDAGPNANGMVAYQESTPLYLGESPEDLVEFAEIPVAVGQIGLPRIAMSTRQGKAVRVSKDMKDMNQLDYVNLQITQLTNSMIQAEERALRAALSDPSIPTIPASVAWTSTSAKIRHDIAAAQEKIASATPNATAADDYFGFEADAIVFPSSITPVLLDNDEFLKVYKDGQNAENIQYTGKMPNDVMGMTALKSRTWPKDRVLVLERNTVGFYSDQRPLTVTPLYAEGGGPNGGPREAWRSDATMRRVIGADQPKAACWITGVQGV